MYGADIVFFLKGIPMMAALALQPHRRQAELQLRLGYLDFVSLLTWWTFLYVFVVFPWMYALPSEAQYNFNYDLITNIQNMVIVAGLGIFMASFERCLAPRVRESFRRGNAVHAVVGDDQRRHLAASLFDRKPLRSSV